LSSSAWFVNSRLSSHGKTRGVQDTYNAGCFEMLDVLADTHYSTSGAKLLFDCLPRGDCGCAVALAEEVPREESAEVLEESQGLFAAESGRDETNVVRNRGVVD
jgi:hypothetical protein